MERVSANGISIAFERRGSGPPLVLMHGNEADHSMFDALAGRLAGRFTVYVYDQRDCGATENADASYTLTDLGDDAAAFIAALGLARAHVYGSSLGGLVAQSLAIRHPNRVDRLVLGNTWRIGTSPADFSSEAVSKLAAYRSDLSRNAPKIAEFFFPSGFIREQPTVIELFRQNTRSEEKRARRGAVLENLPVADISGFPRDVLLLTGAEDRLIPPEITMAITSSANATRIKLEGIGHAAPIQAPDRVAEVLTNFLLDRHASA